MIMRYLGADVTRTVDLITIFVPTLMITVCCDKHIYKIFGWDRTGQVRKVVI
jgi:hypothetical protein